MQRPLLIVFALFILHSSLPAGVQAQDPVATAAREEAADNYRIVASKVNRLEEELLSYQSRMLKLSEETHKLREEVDRQKNRNENAATLEKISRLQDAIKQVDEARQEDNKRVLAEIARLRTLLEKAVKVVGSSGSSTPPPTAPSNEDTSSKPPPSRTAPATKSTLENSYKYTVKKGDTLSGIASGLRAQGYRVSARQIEEANPGVNWAKIAIGREIIIPPPSPTP